MRLFLVSAISTIALSSCQSLTDTPILDSTSEKIETLSVASVQLINVGDGQSEVIKLLGMPNIITKSTSGNTSWVYDKVGTYFELVEASTDGGLRLFGSRKETGTVTKSVVTSKTFIIIVDFDEKSNVAELSYRYTQY